MSTGYESKDPEKGFNPSMKLTADELPGTTHIIGGDALADNAETTHRGLKSRHAQMIALGGTIGTG